jgi:hypothetical protein
MPLNAQSDANNPLKVPAAAAAASAATACVCLHCLLTQGMQSSITGYRLATLIAMSASMPWRMLQLLLQVRSSPCATLLQKKKSCSDMLQTQKHKHAE